MPRSKPDPNENQPPIGAVRLNKRHADDAAAARSSKSARDKTRANSGDRPSNDPVARPSNDPVARAAETPAAPRRQRRALSHVGGEVSYAGEPDLRALCEAALEQRSAESDTRAHVHGFHAYPARLHPRTAQELIVGLSRGGETVLDPFCGSGTVLVESVIVKRNALGTDLNPLATLLAQTKCAGLSPRNQETLLELAAEVKAFADERRLAKAGPTRKYGPVERDLFDIHVLLELDSLRAAIEKTPKGPLQQNLQLILSSLLVKLSRQSSDTVERTAPRRIAAGYPSKLFHMRALEWLRQVQEYEGLAPMPRAKFRTYTADARELKPVADGSVDLIVTSPPYPGVYDYYAHHAVRLRWMNLKAAELERKELGSKRTLVNQTDGIAVWRSDWKAVLAQFERVLRSGGHACIVMADSAVARTLLRADTETRRAMESTSLSLVAHAKQARPLFHRATETAYDKQTRSEHLLVVRKL